MSLRLLAQSRWVYAAVCGLALLVFGLAQAAGGGWAQPDAPRRGVTFDPEIRYESRNIGPSQQFEMRLRLVLPNRPQGYGIGFRQTVTYQEAVTGRFLRLSARLPGLARGPRPYLELSVVSRSR